MSKCAMSHGYVVYPSAWLYALGETAQSLGAEGSVVQTPCVMPMASNPPIRLLTPFPDYSGTGEVESGLAPKVWLCSPCNEEGVDNTWGLWPALRQAVGALPCTLTMCLRMGCHGNVSTCPLEKELASPGIYQVSSLGQAWYLTWRCWWQD